jgi:hypothetical protein
MAAKLTGDAPSSPGVQIDEHVCSRRGPVAAPELAAVQTFVGREVDDTVERSGVEGDAGMRGRVRIGIVVDIGDQKCRAGADRTVQGDPEPQHRKDESRCSRTHSVGGANTID